MRKKTEEMKRFESGEFDYYLTKEEIEEYEKYERSKQGGFGKQKRGMGEEDGHTTNS